MKPTSQQTLSAPPAQPSLVRLAELKQLPIWQYMDAETLAWIEAHHPAFPAVAPLPQLSEEAKRLLSYAAIPPDWQLEPNIIDSIHGLRHSLRTAVLAVYLASFNNLPSEEQARLIIIGAIHDCRRENDNADPDHGLRTADWFRTNVATVEHHFRVSLPVVVQAQMADAIQLHATPYAEFTPAQEDAYRKAKVLTDLLKTADALDRYRLPKLKWWPNDELIHVIAPTSLKRLAYELVITSEANHLAGAGSAQSVNQAVVNKGLV